MFLGLMVKLDVFLRPAHRFHKRRIALPDRFVELLLADLHIFQVDAVELARQLKQRRVLVVSDLVDDPGRRH